VNLFTVLLDLMYPPKCPFCGRVVKEQGVCEACLKSLPRTGTSCKRKGDYFTLCVSPLYYRDNVRESLLRFKFQNCRHYAKTYAPMVAECIEKEFNNKFDLISWVPVSRKRLRRRGYDQARLLAEEIAALYGIKAVSLLEKHRHVPAQSGISGAEKRKANILSAYRVIDHDSACGKRILLIDDIITTGATLSECSKTLLLSGAEEILCATVARDHD